MDISDVADPQGSTNEEGEMNRIDENLKSAPTIRLIKSRIPFLLHSSAVFYIFNLKLQKVLK